MAGLPPGRNRRARPAGGAAGALGRHPRDAQAATAPAPAAAAAPPTGIIDNVRGALPTSKDRLLNAWQGEVDGRLLAVYAGARAGDGGQGVVVVVALERGNTARFSQHALATPSRSGAVRVVAAHAPLVTLLLIVSIVYLRLWNAPFLSWDDDRTAVVLAVD